MARRTLAELDEMIQRMKKDQVALDSQCHLNSDEFCSYCRYVNGYWGDIVVEITLGQPTETQLSAHP